MRLRLKLLRIILRNCKPLFFIPIIIAYCLLPGVSAFKYFYVDSSEARSTFIYMTQVFIPLCGLLWPMGYLHVWVEGDGCSCLHKIPQNLCWRIAFALFSLFADGLSHNCICSNHVPSILAGIYASCIAV